MMRFFSRGTAPLSKFQAGYGPSALPVPMPVQCERVWLRETTYHQAQLARAVLPRKVVDIRDCFANVRANVYRLLLCSLRIL